MSKNLKNKNVLITGGGLGIGFEIAKHFCDQESNVIICGRNGHKLEQAKSQICGQYPKAKIEVLTCDISRATDVTDLNNQLKNQNFFCEILILNAGVLGQVGKFEDLSYEEFSKTIDTNLLSSFLMIKTFLNDLKVHENAKILQLAGGGATSPRKYHLAYSASKCSVVRFIETIALELKSYNIDANCISPGIHLTPMTSESLNKNINFLSENEKVELIKLKNGQSSNIDNLLKLVSFLSSDESKGISGKIFSAQWDNLTEIKKTKNQILHSDVFTLRRISGKDRELEFLDI